MLFSCPDHGHKLAEGWKSDAADGVQCQAGQVCGAASGYGVLLSKNQHRESTILEGYFKQLGMSGEELQTAVQDFKTKRATQAKEKETSYQNAQQEIVRLKAQVLYCIVS